MRKLPGEPAVVVPDGELGQVPGDHRLPRLLGLGTLGRDTFPESRAEVRYFAPANGATVFPGPGAARWE